MTSSFLRFHQSWLIWRSRGIQWLNLGTNAATSAAHFILHTPRNFGVTLLHLNHMKHILQLPQLKARRWSKKKISDFRNNKGRIRFLLSACVISWTQESISDEELQQTIQQCEHETGEYFLSKCLETSIEPPVSFPDSNDKSQHGVGDHQDQNAPSITTNCSEPTSSSDSDTHAKHLSKPKRPPPLIWERRYEVDHIEIEDYSNVKETPKNEPVQASFSAHCESYSTHECVVNNDTSSVHIDKQEDGQQNDWELVLDQGAWCRMWKRPSQHYPDLYEYMVRGTFHDITARAFFEVQTNLKFRRTWDKDVISLEVLDKQGETELVRWVSQFPYRMSPREYVYVRRTEVDESNRLMILLSRAVRGNSLSVDQKRSSCLVRVTEYESNMFIRPHRDFEEPGFDYFLFYCDNPKANFQKLFYNWAATTAVPNLLKQVHQATKTLEQQGWLLQQQQSSQKQLTNVIDPISSDPSSSETEEKKERKNSTLQETYPTQPTEVDEKREILFT